MNDLQFELEYLQLYFACKNWKVEETDKGLFFYKQGTTFPQTDKITTNKIKKINGFFPDLYNQFNEITINYFATKLPSLTILEPKNIYDGYNNNSFVSTGLEYYYDYLYKNSALETNGTMVIQPSIRFKLNFFDIDLYNNNDKYDYSSISFNNISIVEQSNNCDIIEKIENVLDYLSKLGIHASRVNFVIENKIRVKENGVSYGAIKFYVDNLEVGDILVFKNNSGYLIEYGFGFERLMSRILNKKYHELFIDDSRYEQNVLLGVNFLTSLCMFDNQQQNRGARSKINEVLKALNETEGVMNIDLIYSNYLYWNQILKDTQYQTDFDHVTKRYLKLLRR